jgi:hypothetical protein
MAWFSSVSYTPKKLVSHWNPYALDHGIVFGLVEMIKRADHCLQIHQQIHIVQPVHSGKTLSRMIIGYL